MSKATLSQKLRYKFDNTMSKGPGALILWLAIITTIMIILSTIVALIFSVFPPEASDETKSVSENLWQHLMRAMDPGAVAADDGWAFRGLMFLVTLGGIFILSTLIGILSNGIDEKLQELRKGRSFVVEKNHQLILGWNTKVFTIIQELSIANMNQKRPRIVVMAEVDKTFMEDEIREKCPDLHNTKVICRSGDPNDITDLNIVNPEEAKSIIILSDESKTDSDAQTIKNLLAIVNNPTRKKEKYHIVAEMREEKNLHIGKIVGKDEVELLLTDDLISRIMVQTCRQSGLSMVYTEITGYDGDEMYIIDEPQLIGKTYAEALFMYNDSSVIGIQFPDGSTKVNPPMDTVFEKGSKVIGITEDDDTMIINAPSYTIDKDQIVRGEAEPPQKERTLVLCWNNKGKSILRELGNYVDKGSELVIVSNQPGVDEEIASVEVGENLKVTYIKGDPTSRPLLESLNVETFTQIIVLSKIRHMNVQEADSQTLISLLHLRDILDIKNAKVRIVSEIMDSRNRELASVTKADDFVISDRLISKLVSQVSESKNLVSVFNDMFDAEGSEIYLKPASSFVKVGVPVDFYTVMESARAQNMSAIGYRIMADQYNSAKHYGVLVNPVKSDKVTFAEEDLLIVLAED